MENNKKFIDQVVDYMNDAYLQYQPSSPTIKKKKSGWYADCDGEEFPPNEALEWFIEMVDGGEIDFDEITEETGINPELGPKLYEEAKEMI